MKSIFFFAGEPSGDLHGGRLIEAMRAQSPEIICRGIGGPSMRSKGLKGTLKMEDFQVMGFSDVLFSLPKLLLQYFQVKREILKINPDAVVLIDYPGFNLRLAKGLRKAGYHGKIVQYVAPTVWAHGKGRIKTMSDHLDLLLTIYPFEKELFAHTPLDVLYVGNPLVETIQNHSYNNRMKYSSDNLLALFPGSRKGEIERNLPLMLEAVQILQSKDPSITIGLSVSHEQFNSVIDRYLKKYPIKNVAKVSSQYNYELMKDCRLALAKSGTVTLELALHQKPAVVIYSLSHLNYLIAKYILKLHLPYYCIVNILTGKEVYPEIIGRNISSKLVAEKIEECGHTPIAIKELLGSQNAHEHAARAILEVMDKGPKRR